MIFLSTYVILNYPVSPDSLRHRTKQVRAFSRRALALYLNPAKISIEILIQRVALARIVGFVTNFLDSSTGWWAILQLLCSQGWKKIARGTSKKYKQNLLFELTPLSVEVL